MFDNRQQFIYYTFCIHSNRNLIEVKLLYIFALHVNIFFCLVVVPEKLFQTGVLENLSVAIFLIEFTQLVKISFIFNCSPLLLGSSVLAYINKYLFEQTFWTSF